MTPGSVCSHAVVLLSVLLCQLHLCTTSEQHGAPPNNTQHSPNNTQHPPNKHSHPCMPSAWRSAYDTFLKRHLPEDQPSSLDQNQWESFIRQHKLCHRPTQSFLHPEDKQQVLDVCSAAGGRTMQNNLCISGQEFSFTTVHLLYKDCTIKKVFSETKHLILACDDIDGVCRPVHFQRNPNGTKPDQNRQPPCEWPQSSGTERTIAGCASVMLPLSLLWPLWY
ncbi:uncharacterized protein LOC121720399 isoform X2 [Alosa sapidissima]|uniref:uncharacterized protein LOC121720399 isoform X2 n=1 Tax=Alosa sapidissima TaxID=34773 RepID=UPI001C08A030|nr:uncharacterized protein LOC121720399 isoform X2 [Alosa sapidissima]